MMRQIIFILGVALVAFGFATTIAAGLQAIDPFVSMIERHIGAEYNVRVYPGVTKTVPECNCTFRYVGTVVHGRRYSVIIDKLD